MNPNINVLVVTDGATDQREVEALIDSAPVLEMVELIDNEHRWASRETLDYDAVIVMSDGRESSLLLRLIADASRDASGKPVVAAVGHADGYLVEHALEAGADDIVVVDDADHGGREISFAIQKAVARRQGQSGTTEEQGRQIVVLGPKGGTGKTLTSANLAVALAAGGRKVTLVDLDLQFGDLGLVLALHPEKTLYDLAISGGTLDAEKVASFTSEHSTGLRVLLAPIRPDQAAVITPEFLRDLYRVLRESNDVVVVDTPPGFTPEVIVTIDASSDVCMLGMLDAPSLKNAKLGLETLELMGYPADRIRLVLNRADTSVGISHADVVRILGKAPDVLVPSTRDIVRSINAAQPIVLSKSRTEAGKAFQVLAELFAADLPSKTPERSRGRGRRLLTRS